MFRKICADVRMLYSHAPINHTTSKFREPYPAERGWPRHLKRRSNGSALVQPDGRPLPERLHPHIIDTVLGNSPCRTSLQHESGVL
jgi:hypothetical protein